MTDGSPTKAGETPPGIDLARSLQFELGELRVSPATREAAAGERREILEPRVMQALVALSRRRGEVVSRDELIATCWDGRIVGDDAINGCIAKVRRLGEAHGAFAIETIPRVGYRLTETSTPKSKVAAGRRPRWGLIGAVLAGMIVVAGLALAAWALRPAPTLRVAVTAFQAAPGDAVGQALADGVRDQVASVLTARQVSVTRIGSQRGARLIVAGAVERTGDQARVRVHIDDPRGDLVLWQGEFVGAAAPGSPIAEQTAAKVTDLVYQGAKLLNASRGDARPQALKSAILGLEASREGRSVEWLEFSRELRRQAPNLGMAHATYSQALLQGAGGQPPDIARAWRKSAQDEADLALKLDPNDASAYYAQHQLTAASQFDRREHLLDEGLARAPGDGSLNVSKGLLLADVGRPREGVAFIERGLALDPLSPPKTFGDAAHLASLGLVDEGRALLDHGRRVWPNIPYELRFSLMFAVQSAPPDEGLIIVDDMARKFPAFAGEAHLWRDYLEAVKCGCGQAAVGERIDAAALAGQAPPGLSVPALSRLQLIDKAFAVAGRDLPKTGFQETRLLFGVATAPMRNQPEFMDLASSVGLISYWRASNNWPEFCGEPLPYDCKVEAARVAAAKR